MKILVHIISQEPSRPIPHHDVSTSNVPTAWPKEARKVDDEIRDAAVGCCVSIGKTVERPSGGPGYPASSQSRASRSPPSRKTCPDRLQIRESEKIGEISNFPDSIAVLGMLWSMLNL